MLHSSMRNHILKGLRYGLTLKLTQGHRNWLYLIGYNHFLLVVRSNSNPNWHRFRDITTCTMYVTDGGLEKCFIFKQIVEITSVHYAIRV